MVILAVNVIGNCSSYRYELCPGVEAKNQPCGTMKSSIDAREAPASQQKIPFSRSNRMNLLYLKNQVEFRFHSNNYRRSFYRIHRAAQALKRIQCRNLVKPINF
jgi:hypothetical protein